MTSLKTLGVMAILISIACLSSEQELLERPPRPEKFASNFEVQQYLQKLKAWAESNRGRFGKRFVPAHYDKPHPHQQFNGNVFAEDNNNLPVFYQMFRQYYDKNYGK